MYLNLEHATRWVRLFTLQKYDLMHNLIPYFIHHQYQTRTFNGQQTAIALNMDIHGFTAMTEELIKHGQAGEEKLVGIINQLFEPIVQVIYRYGGDVVNFAGDGMTVIWPQDDSDTAVQAITAAQQIRHIFAERGSIETPFGHFDFVVKLGLAAGQIEWGIVGNNTRKNYYFRGPAVVDCHLAEGQVLDNEIVVTETLYQLLPPLYGGFHSRDEQKTYYTIPNQPLSPHDEQLEQPNTIPARHPYVTEFYPQSLWEKPSEGEFRDVAILFLTFQNQQSFDQLNSFISQIMDICDRFAGHFVELQFTSKSGVCLIYFGAPIAHENDLSRALHAADALRHELDSDMLNWRAGMAFGHVYTGYVGSPQRDKFACIGSVANLSYRLATNGEWSEVWVTSKLVQQQEFEFQAVGEIKYKGFANPVKTYRLSGQTSHNPIFTSPLIGRAVDLTALYQLAQNSFDQSTLNVAIIYGTAGMGKSHLTFTLSHHLRNDATWIKAQCDPLLNDPFNPFIYALRQYFQQSPEVDSAINKSRFQQQWQFLLHKIARQTNSSNLSSELNRLHSFLGALLGLHWLDSRYANSSGEEIYKNTILAITYWLLAESRCQPLVLEIDDAHRIDPASHETIETITRLLAPCPLLIVLSSRYHHDGEQPVFRVDRPGEQITTIYLEPFSRDTLRLQAEELLGQKIDDHLLNLIAEKSDNNPFFAQQVLHYLRDNNMLELRLNNDDPRMTINSNLVVLPASLNTLLLSRLDRLPPDVRTVVQTASVLGREFETRLLAEMMGYDVSQAAGIAEQQQIWSQTGALKHMFKHALMRDAAYNMQMRSNLCELHFRAAQAGEHIYRNQRSNYYNVIAYHYETAYHMGKTEAADASHHYLWLAGQQAMDKFENSFAIDMFSRALEVVQKHEWLKKYELLQAREACYDRIGDREAQYQDLQQLADLITQPNEIKRKAEILLRQSHFAEATGEYRESLALAGQAVRWAQLADNKRIQIQAHLVWGNALCQLGEFQVARTQYDLALALTEPAEREHILSLSGLGLVATEMGDLAMAMSYYNKALEISQILAIRPEECRVLTRIGTVAFHDGRYDDAQQYYQNGLKLSQEIGNRRMEGQLLSHLGNVLFRTNDLVQAFDIYQQGLTLCRETGDRSEEAAILLNLGVITSTLGDHTKSLDFYTVSLALSREIGDQTKEGMSLVNLGHMAYLRQQHSQALHYYQLSLTIWLRTGQKRAEAQALSDISRVFIAQERFSEAKVAIEEGLALRLSLNNQVLYIESQIVLAELYQAQGKTEEAYKALEGPLRFLHEGHNFSGSQYGLRNYLSCYGMLSPHEPETAADLLNDAYQQLKISAEKIADKNTRVRFLNNVPWHRQIIDIYQRLTGVQAFSKR